MALQYTQVFVVYIVASFGFVIFPVYHHNPHMQSKGTLAVVGVGYVGLPLALLAREKGWNVIGIDIDRQKVAGLNREHRISATTNAATAAEADVIVVAVPTPVTSKKLPDLRPLTSAVKSLVPHLRAGQTLIVESTVDPGVMDEVVLPLLHKRPALKGLAVAYCPERVNPGDPQWSVRNIPRVLGAATPSAREAALAFYRSILEAPITIMDSMTEAEAVKIFENSFRDVNIAFVNEMARSFDQLGIDVLNVIRGASTKPFAFLPHYPGNGVGGHCISVDPYYMIERGKRVGFNHKFLKLARAINDSMPAFTLTLLRRGLKAAQLPKAKARIALLGLAYKKDTADDRESPAVEIHHLLKAGKWQYEVFDPYLPKQSTATSLDEALKNTNVVMLATNHSTFTEALTPARLKRAGIKLVIDGKNALDADGIARVGILYIGIGRSRLAAVAAE